MRLAPARPGDAARLGQIMLDWLNETPWIPKPHSGRQDTAFLRRLIARMDVTTLRNWRGVQGFMAREGETIHAMYLTRAVRGQGWGGRMLDRAKAAVPRLTVWSFQANTRARAFYARHGFVEVEMTDGADNDEGLPDVRLVWPAPPGGSQQEIHA